MVRMLTPDADSMPSGNVPASWRPLDGQVPSSSVIRDALQFLDAWQAPVGIAALTACACPGGGLLIGQLVGGIDVAVGFRTLLPHQPVLLPVTVPSPLCLQLGCWPSY